MSFQVFGHPRFGEDGDYGSRRGSELPEIQQHPSPMFVADWQGTRRNIEFSASTALAATGCLLCACVHTVAFFGLCLLGIPFVCLMYFSAGIVWLMNLFSVCDQPLNTYLGVYLLYLYTCAFCSSRIFESLCMWSPARGTPAPLRARVLLYALPVFPLLWMMHGRTLHGLEHTCQKTNPFLYSFFPWFAWVAIILHSIYLAWLALSIGGLPILLFLLRRTALNPVLIWLAEQGFLRTPSAAHPNSINRMDVVEYKPELFADSQDPSDIRPQGECCICLEAYDATKQIRRTPCGHMMHHSCLALWLQTANTCPACRQTFDGSASQMQSV